MLKTTSKTADWKQIPLSELFASLETTEDGLDDGSAAIRLKAGGLNEIARKKKVSLILKFLSYFKDPLVLILFAAALLSALVGEFKNLIIISSIVLLSVLLNFYQEHKSGKAAEKIADRLAVRSTVLRNGKKREISVKEIVPGDIVALSAGDIIPADGRVVSADDFFVNESALTGESLPVEKSPKSGAVSAGTNVIAGSALVLAVRTGRDTEYGSIAEKLVSPKEANAFETGIKNFGYLIVKLVFFIVILIFIINLARQRDVVDTLLFSVAVAVGLTPELLPMILSINMAKGSIKMSKLGVLVKRLNAIPDFGSMDILCTDKTGTLTEDRITVVRHIDAFGRDSERVLRLAYINSYFETGLKNMMDKAIMEFRHIDIKSLKKVDEIPYDFERKRLSVIYAEGADHEMVTKGAPEEIFRISAKFLDGNKFLKITPSAREKFQATYDEMCAQGFRVLAVAIKNVKDSQEIYPKNEEKDMCFCGFICFYDPPKKDVKDTLEFIKRHGVEVKILSGDSPLVVKKICEELDFEVKGIISGDEIDLNEISDEELAVKAAGANIFARFSPQQKERVIIALKKHGSVVGYLGDGINDAPALKAADVGISVENAVDIAKETADIILMKKGLKELMDGILEGRRTFANTIKYILMGISSNFGNMFSMIGAALFLPFFPMLPGQILLNNFLYDVSQVSIPSDKVDREYLKKPKHWNMKYIRNFMLVFGPLSTIFDLLTFYILYVFFKATPAVFQTGWFIESLATQVFVIYIIRTRRIPFIKSRPSKLLFATTIGVVLTGIIIASTAAGKFFGFSPLPLKILLAMAGLVIVYLLMVELVKQIFYRRFKGME